MQSRKNFKYCFISRPTTENEFTKMFCIQEDDYLDLKCENKDFLWDWEDPITKIHYHKIIDRKYIINHSVPPTYKGRDGLYFRISFKNLEAY